MKSYTELLKGKKYKYPAAGSSSSQFETRGGDVVHAGQDCVMHDSQTASEQMYGVADVVEQEKETQPGEGSVSEQLPTPIQRQELPVLAADIVSEEGPMQRSSVPGASCQVMLPVPEAKDGENDVTNTTRPKRARKQPDVLVVGDPSKWHFNRSKRK